MQPGCNILESKHAWARHNCHLFAIYKNFDPVLPGHSRVNLHGNTGSVKDSELAWGEWRGRQSEKETERADACV